MIIKIVIVLLLFVTIYSLGRAMFSLIKPDADSNKTLRALTWRISLSIALFVLLMVSYQLGWIHPHGAVPPGR